MMKKIIAQGSIYIPALACVLVAGCSSSSLDSAGLDEEQSGTAEPQLAEVERPPPLEPGSPPEGHAPFDFDGDDRTDLVWRSETRARFGAAVQWDIDQSSSKSYRLELGDPGDVPAIADYDGDGLADLAVWRPSNGDWIIRRSSSHRLDTTPLGTVGDVPAPGDYDGDGLADLAVWRPDSHEHSPPQGKWHTIQSSGGDFALDFGIPGDIPATGDYDGDGKTDLAVWRPSNGTWIIRNSSNHEFYTTLLGLTGDVPVPGDYDGDGKADVAVWRPDDHGQIPQATWHTVQSSGGAISVDLGAPGDVPMVGDYDGDGKTDVGVWRVSGEWMIRSSSSGQVARTQADTGSLNLHGPVTQCSACCELNRPADYQPLTVEALERPYENAEISSH